MALLDSFIADRSIVVLLAGLVVSLVMLTKFSGLAVDHAAVLARTLGVSPAVIGATVVSIGTTLPEVTVSLVASLGGNSSLAAGNAIGSIVANVALISGLLLVITPRRPAARAARGPALTALLALVVVGVTIGLTAIRATMDAAFVPRVVGVLLVVALPVYLVMTFRTRPHVDEPVVADGGPSGPVAVTTLIVLASTFGVVIASRLTLPIVVALARRFGIPESFIAATLVALGTSLPELFTSLRAARVGHPELGLGNVAGANVMNLLLVIGLSATVSPNGLAVDRFLLTRMMPAALLVSLAFYLIVRAPSPRTSHVTAGTRVRRVGLHTLFGAALLALYAGIVLSGTFAA